MRMPHTRRQPHAKPAPSAQRRPWSTRVRSGAPKRQEQDEAAASGLAPARAQLHQGTLHSLAWVSQQLAGLTPSGGETALPPSEALELVVEVEFAGYRSGRVTLAFARGLTRQIGSNMSHMANLDGRQLNALEAAKEMASATTAELLQMVFGLDARFRIGQAQAMPPRPLLGELQLAMAFTEGTVAVAVEIGQTSARHAG
jgi:hypothetical protein